MNDRSTHLRALLQKLLPYNDTEARYLEQMLALLQLKDPFHRKHFSPGHFTASAFVLAPDDKRLLLIHHRKLHRWLQPGGHIDPDDTHIIAAAQREVQEETGLPPNQLTLLSPTIFDIDIHNIPALHDEKPHQHFDIRFLFRAHTTQYTAGSDAKDAKWWPLHTINEIDSDPSVTRAVEKILHL